MARTLLALLGTEHKICGNRMTKDLFKAYLLIRKNDELKTLLVVFVFLDPKSEYL